MKANKNDNNIKSAWKLLTSEKGKKFSFLIFYVIFFIFLFVFMGKPDVDIKNNSNNEDLSLPFITENFEDDSYIFNFIVNANSEKIVYEGNKRDKTIVLQNDSKVYNLTYENDKLISSEEDNIIPNLEFLDIFELKKIIKNATLISETKFPNTNEYEYSYEISNQKIGEVLEIETDLSDLNKIIIKTDDKKKATLIDLDITNFINQFLEEKYTSYILTIEYGESYE